MLGPKLKVAAGVVAGAALSGGLAYALPVIPAADGTIHACVSYSDSNGSPKAPPVARGNGGVRIVESPSHCTSSEMPLSWNQEGPKGDTGPRGEVGATGPQGPAGTGEAWWRSHTTPHGLPSSGADQVVLTASVPAGYYTLSASVFVRSADDDDYIAHCSLRVNGTSVFDATQSFVDGYAFGVLALTGAAQLTAPGTVDVMCYTFFNGIEVANRSLVATQVAALH